MFPFIFEVVHESASQLAHEGHLGNTIDQARFHEVAIMGVVDRVVHAPHFEHAQFVTKFHCTMTQQPNTLKYVGSGYLKL